MQRLLLLFGVSLVFSLGLLTQAQTQQYELVPNWAKLPEGWVFGHPQEFPMPSVRDKARAEREKARAEAIARGETCLLYTSPSPRDRTRSRMPSSA